MKWFIFTFIFSMNAFASSSPIINWKGKEDQHTKKYFKLFHSFRSQICQNDTEKKFDELLKKYRGTGYWIPRIHDDVDVKAIKELIPLMEEKIVWIKKQIKKIQTFGLPSSDVVKTLEKNLYLSLEFKKNELSESHILKRKMRKKSLSLQNKLKMSYEILINRLSFLTSFHYPVDHLKNRRSYEEYKNKPSMTHLANKIFLKRKILEDGAYNPDHTDFDMFLRTTLDTLHFELDLHGFYITENARYDLKYVIEEIKSELSRGQKKILARLKEWETRSQNFLNFYRKLASPESQLLEVNEGLSLNKKMVKHYNEASRNLKNFVYEKQADVYKFWSKQPQLYRALFVIETILLNEVGTVDGKDALERQDVARVIINRLGLPRYLEIEPKEYLYSYLENKVGANYVKKEKWLNALFKQGEFSFTYYYMSSVKNTFCPDISYGAKKLRRQNLGIALEVLKLGKTNFSATRYFSRASMTGRISMDIVWDNYGPYPERPGKKLEKSQKILKKFKKKDYFYLYSFKDHEGDLYKVIEVDDRPYVMRNQTIFTHRNPHYFRYFTKLDDLVKK